MLLCVSCLILLPLKSRIHQSLTYYSSAASIIKRFCNISFVVLDLNSADLDIERFLFSMCVIKVVLLPACVLDEEFSNTLFENLSA